jgi:hypothetical protein
MKRKTWWRLFAKANRDEQRGLIVMAAAVTSLTAKLASQRCRKSGKTCCLTESKR